MCFMTRTVLIVPTLNLDIKKRGVTKWSQLSGLLYPSLVISACMTIWAILDSNQ